MITDTVFIGYWRSNYENTRNEDLPWPIPDTPKQAQDSVINQLIDLMDRATWKQYRGWSTCRICGCHNGSKELEINMGTTRYVIPEGYLHYISDHLVGYDERILQLI